MYPNGNDQTRTTTPSLIEQPRITQSLEPLISLGSRATSSIEFPDLDVASDPRIEEHGTQDAALETFVAAVTVQDLRSLGEARPVEERVAKLKTLAIEASNYSTSDAIKILECTSDLRILSAPYESRVAIFSLVNSVLRSRRLSSNEYLTLAQIAFETCETDLLEDQVHCVRRLTIDGSFWDNLGGQYTYFLRSSLTAQVEAVFETRKQSKTNPDRRESLTRQERGLHSILQLIQDEISSNSESLTDDVCSSFIDNVLFVAEKTTSRMDMRRALGVLCKFVRNSKIPNMQLQRCVEILCAIYKAVQELGNVTWECLMVLLASPIRYAVLEVLLKTVKVSPHDRYSHTISGVLAVLKYLYSNHGRHGQPSVSISLFLGSLCQAHFESQKVRIESMKTISYLVQDEFFMKEIEDNDWDTMISTIRTIAAKDPYVSKASDPRGSTGRSTQTFSEKPADCSTTNDIVQELRRIAETFLDLWPSLVEHQRDSVAKFHHEFQSWLSFASLQQLLECIATDALSAESHTNRCGAFDQIVASFLLKRSFGSEIRKLIIKILKDIVLQAVSSHDSRHFTAVSVNLLQAFSQQPEPGLAEPLSALVLVSWAIAPPLEIKSSVTLLWPLLECEDGQIPSPPVRTGPKSLIEPHPVSGSIVLLFKEYLSSYRSGAAAMYPLLLKVARSSSFSMQKRLPVLELFARLRRDQGGHLLVETSYDSLGLVTSLLSSQSSREYETLMSSQRHSSYNRYALSGLTSQHSLPPKLATVQMTPFSRTQHRLKKHDDQWHSPMPDHPEEEYDRIKLSEWLIVLIEILQQSDDWDAYILILTHLPSQLCNPSLFRDSIPHLQMLRNVVSSQLQSGRFRDAPPESGLKKSDIAYCLIQTLVILLGFSDNFARTEQEDLVRTFLVGIGGWDGTAKASIHALALCCHVVPNAMTKAFPGVLQKMSQIITQSDLATDILEFLGSVARLPMIYRSLREEEFRTVFAICVRYLEHSREQRLRLMGGSVAGVDYSSTRTSAFSVESLQPLNLTQDDVHRDLPQYVFVLAYHVMTLWFLSLRLVDRPKYVGWITKNLAWKDQHGNERMEEQSQVTLDMMHRTAYLDLGETAPATEFSPLDGTTMKKTWLLGMSLVTVETAIKTGLTKLIKRQATGTTFATYRQDTAPLPSHHVQSFDDASVTSENTISIFPNHVFLQLTSTIAPIPSPLEAICLPDDEATKRALLAFDRNDTVDGYKVGIIYVSFGQSSEAEILANTRGSAAFDRFLHGIGTRVKLKGATFNTQGLDRDSDSDGEFTHAWRDRVAEIVFHVPTLMPSDIRRDPRLISKKRHIGNDYVNVIFNESGLLYDLETFPSQFNFINIIITPDHPDKSQIKDVETTKAFTDDDGMKDEAQEIYYTVQTVSHHSLPRISPTSMLKLVPLSKLPALVRQIALNSSVFCNVWANRDGGEYVSSWRNRLREIMKLRERFENTGTSTSTKYPGAKWEKKYTSGDIFRGRVEMGGLAEEEGILAGLDFSRWAGPNPPPL